MGKNGTDDGLFAEESVRVSGEADLHEATERRDAEIERVSDGLLCLRKAFAVVRALLAEPDVSAVYDRSLYRPSTFVLDEPFDACGLPCACRLLSPHESGFPSDAHGLGQAHLLYSTFTGELLLCAADPMQAGDGDFAYLVAHGFLVKTDADELKNADEVRSLALLFENRKDTGYGSYTILTTTDCNARCFYCYERGCEKLTMDEQTAHETAAYILRSARSEGKVKLAWFGGEPLVNARAIDTICADMRAAGREYRSSMISNGFLFDEQLVERACDEWNLGSIQITLDGTREVYNKRKGYVNVPAGEDPFGRVLRNIGLLADAGVRVSVRLNADEHNMEDLRTLCDQIAVRFAGSEKVRVYAHLLFGDQTSSDRVDELEGEFAALCAHIRELGLASDPGLPSHLLLNACMADGNRSAVVLPDGSLNACEHFNEIPAPWGSIRCDSDRPEAHLRMWRTEREVLPECADCAYYPQCIRLLNCPNGRDFCFSHDRDRRVSDLRKAMHLFAEKALCVE